MSKHRTYFKKLKFPALLAFLLVLIVDGCASIPEQTQLVQHELGNGLIRSAEECNEDSFATNLPFLYTDRLDTENISILNWNIYKGLLENWDKDLQRLSAKRDIIILQEAPLNERLEEMLDEQRFHWTLNHAFAINGTEVGVLTASKVKPLESCGLRHTEPLIRLPKTTLINRYKLSGTSKTLLVANIHGINFTLGTKSYTNQMKSLQDILHRHDGPLIVAGDFNSWSTGRRNIMIEMVNALELWPLTCKTANRCTIFGSTVDHIFYRGLEPVTHETHVVSTSDHNPITAQFRVVPLKLAEQE
ncbi:MAG: endonuclease/exonuclease/phosphatase family protein [Thermodesulfobacteriota bacterium]|nr:endonuclease/exonuclease/phosphatase family protein [Thermodesulfobacteriota bacterium]